MPLGQGFDQYYGIPYSNDMKPTVLMRNGEFIEAEADQVGITTRYTDEALDFIKKNRENPFFLYLAHNMPHTPLYPSKKFEGKSEYGLYGDCIEEIDHNVGRILDKLKKWGLDKNTLVIFTSDNGPWIEPLEERTPEVRNSRLQSGTADPLRGMKMTSWDGGSRVPCIMYYPGVILPGTKSNEVVTAMDFFPTFSKMAGVKVQEDLVIDGKDFLPLVSGETTKSAHEAYYYYKYTHLMAIRSGKYKLVFPRSEKPKILGWYGRLQESIDEPTLYDLELDIGETTNIAANHPEQLKRMQKLAEKAREELGDRELKGRGVRQFF